MELCNRTIFYLLIRYYGIISMFDGYSQTNIKGTIYLGQPDLMLIINNLDNFKFIKFSRRI